MTNWDGDRVWHPRRRFRIRGPLTLVTLLGLLVGATWFGYGTVTGGFEPEPVRICNTPGPGGKQKVAAGEVTVNVYNAGNTYGLASRTAADLRERGLSIGKVTNAEEDLKVSGVMVRGRAKNAPEVLLLKRHLKDEVKVTQDDRQGYSVDLVIGNKFKALAKAPKKQAVTLESPLAACHTAVPTDA